MTIKLYYFPLPGRAEVSRLLLTGGNVDFEDVRVPPPEWPALKPKMPFGQMPVLDIDGTMIAQGKAIDIYSAKIAGFYPQDPLVAAQADMVIFHFDDVAAEFIPTFRIQDPEEKKAARLALLEGSVKTKLTMLDGLLEGKEFVAGDKLSHGDIALFVQASTLRSGFIDGVPFTVLDDYPNIKRLRNKVASLDWVTKVYANETEGYRAAFKPDA